MAASKIAAVLAVALLVAAGAGCGGLAQVSSPSDDGSAGPVAGASRAAQLSPAASSSPSSTPSPSPNPSRPPLDKPTKKHPLRVYFGGDSLAGLPGILFAQHGAKSGLMNVRTDYQVSSRLTNPDPVDWPARVKAQVRAAHPDVGVFMIGANDTGMPMLANGDFTMYPKKEWLTEYQRRARKLATIMLQNGVERVYWVGLPVMPTSSETQKMRRLNELFEDAAAHSPDLVYVDTFDLLATKNGGFKASLRSGDGVHFTDEGAWRIADAVWAAMKRDWRTAQ